MDGNNQYPHKVEALSNGEYDATEAVDGERLRRLVRLLDSSDVSSLEVKLAGEGTRKVHLVLRKAQAPGDGEPMLVASLAAGTGAAGAASGKSKEAQHPVTSPLVGIFHVWAKPRGGALVVVGDHVKLGQLVGTIQSLNVLNEVEAGVAGRVVEVLVQDGQAVEYGQPLMTIDSSAEEA